MSEAPKTEDVATQAQQDPTNDIWTVANIITVLRLVLVPFAFVALVTKPYDPTAFWLYAGAAATDWLDGQIARRTGTVTVIGKAIDPLVDRLLLASGVIGLYIVDRLPLWVLVTLVARDAYMLYGAWRLEKYGLRMSVSYIGKATTAALLTGFSMLILGWPTVEIAGTEYHAGIFLVYAGVALSVISAIDYRIRAARMVGRAKKEAAARNDVSSDAGR